MSGEHEELSMSYPSLCTRSGAGHVQKAATADFPVLVLGETGAGKERAARLLHVANLHRRDGPFVALNCGAIDPGTARSRLFGHARGAFTGAAGARKGALLAADEGTLFLDEIADLSLDLQAALLRVLEDGKVFAVGSDRSATTNFRLVCATHKDLRAEANIGRFRLDLYYRVAVLLVRVPPLRERLTELPEIARSVLADLGAGPGALSSSALFVLRSHAWPGNIRELRNVLCRAVVHAGEGRAIHAEHIQLDPPSQSVGADEQQRSSRLSPSSSREELVAALNACQGNRTLAARRLGIARSTLYARLTRAA
jgi:DNA-binding NtrC family response regulator